MDISVSRLNERMALRVPSALPLGLVFIVGRIEEMGPYLPNPQEVMLHLVEGSHSLICRLPRQVADEMQLVGHERVRAGGQLVFDTREARYYLQARDIEVLPSIAASQLPDAQSLPPETRRFLAEIEQRDREMQLAPAELPPWVRQLAPPEIQAELGLASLAAAPASEAVVTETEPVTDTSLIPQEILDFLSAAMDSDEDVELTPDVVGGLAPAVADEDEAALTPSAYDEAAPPDAPQLALPTATLSSRQLTIIAVIALAGFLLLVLAVLLVLAFISGYPLFPPS